MSDGKKSIKLWATLESRLQSEARKFSNIHLHYDTRVEQVGQNDDETWAVTDDGSIFYADILIGADGHRSRVRPHVNPDKPNASYAGYMVRFASIREDDVPKEKRPDASGSNFTMLGGINGGFFFGSIIGREDGAFGSVNRRIGCTFYDNTRNDLLRQLGCLEGNLVHHSLKGRDIPEETLNSLAEEAAVRWPEPWLTATRRALETRQITGIPIKEYVPEYLANGRIALIGDAAHVPAPITASGFNESLLDAAALGKTISKGIKGDAAQKALTKYESMRLSKVQNMVESGMSFGISYGRP